MTLSSTFPFYELKVRRPVRRQRTKERTAPARAAQRLLPCLLPFSLSSQLALKQVDADGHAVDQAQEVEFGVSRYPGPLFCGKGVPCLCQHPALFSPSFPAPPPQSAAARGAHSVVQRLPRTWHSLRPLLCQQPRQRKRIFGPACHFPLQSSGDGRSAGVTKAPHHYGGVAGRRNAYPLGASHLSSRGPARVAGRGRGAQGENSVGGHCLLPSLVRSWCCCSCCSCCCYCCC